MSARLPIRIQRSLRWLTFLKVVKYFAFLDTGGPTRVFTPPTPEQYNPLATESDKWKEHFSALVNLDDGQGTLLQAIFAHSLLELTFDVIWDPSGSRG